MASWLVAFWIAVVTMLYERNSITMPAPEPMSLSNWAASGAVKVIIEQTSSGSNISQLLVRPRISGAPVTASAAT